MKAAKIVYPNVYPVNIHVCCLISLNLKFCGLVLPQSVTPSAVPDMPPNPYRTWLWAPWQKLRHPVARSGMNTF